MSKRINVVLPDATIRTIDRLAKPGQRSRFINHAVQHYVAASSAAALRARLEETVVRDQDLEHEVMEDWFAVDQKQWRNIDQRRLTRKATPVAAKSTSHRSTRPS